MRFRFKGLKEYVKKIENLSNSLNAEVCVENAVTEGSKVVSKITLEALEKMPTDDRRWATPENKRNGLRSYEKKDLIASWGITPLDIKGNLIDRKTGVDRGYNRGGTPNVVIARSLEKGTSFMVKNPVISRASRKARKPCLEAMQESLNRDIDRIFTNNQKRLQRSKI